MRKIRRIIADLLFNISPSSSAVVAALYGYVKRPKRSFSLYGEDLLVLELFNHSSEGVYVDIGAFHERWISNTHALSKLGWSGFVVDVEKEKLISFSMRRNCQARIGAVVPCGFSNDKITLYKFERMSSEYDTTDKVTADDYVRRYGLRYKAVSVPAIPIDQLLESAIKEYSKIIRYLNIDIEGADESILTSFEPQTFGIEVVQFEDNINLGGSPPLRAHMIKCGFSLIASQGGTHTYVANAIIAARFPSAAAQEHH